MVEENGQIRRVVFLLRSGLIRTGVMSQCIGIMLKSVISSCRRSLRIRVGGEVFRQGFLAADWYEFCTILFANKRQGGLVKIEGEGKFFYVGSTVMDEAQLEDKLKELVKEFGGTADSQYRKLAMLAQQAGESQKKLEKSVNSLQESLDYLRVCIKYQLFDLEATRRENEYLRKMLGDNNNDQGPA